MKTNGSTKMPLLDRIGCFVIGWKNEIFAQCGESSRRAMKKYLAAITILAFIWGTVGYCFASNYIGMDAIWKCAIVSIVFIVVIICIERFIILNDGSKWIGAMRIVLAILMATLGSTIFDQIIFEKDVKSQMKDIREEQIQKAIPLRLKIIEADIDRYQKQSDSIRFVTAGLYDEYLKNPTITKCNTNTVKTKTGQYDSDGKEIISTQTVTTREQIANPLGELIASNEAVDSVCQSRIIELQKQKLEIEKIVRKEYENMPTGFLEELAALFKLLGENKIAMVFYIFLFLFLMSLEMLVVSSKFGEKKCDYDLIVENGLKIKEHTLAQMANGLTNPTH